MISIKANNPGSYNLTYNFVTLLVAAEPRYFCLNFSRTQDPQMESQRKDLQGFGY